MSHGILTDYATGKQIRPATAGEWHQSVNAGAFELNGRTVVVEGGPEPVMVGDTYETPEDAAQYAEDEAQALRTLGADREAQMRATEREYEAAQDRDA